MRWIVNGFLPDLRLSRARRVGRVLWVVLLLLPSCAGGGASPPAKRRAPATWIWCGGVTETAAVVKAKVPDPEGVRLLLATDDAFEDPEAFPPEPTSGPGVVAFRLGGLRPDTPYHYAIESKAGRSLSGTFRTFAAGPMSFRVAFGSCATTASNHRVFTAIRETAPLFFLHMGDFHYENIGTNDPALFFSAYDRVLSSKRQSELYRSTSIAYIWDDHDYGPDDSDRLSPSRPAALASYQACVPHYPLTPLQPDQGRIESLHQAFTVGRVRFILTDVRARRSPVQEPDGPGKSMLGPAQRRWLEQELGSAAADHALVVWVNVVPWITRSDPGSHHGWEPYSHERGRVADTIRRLGLTNRLLILSGDAHMVALDDGTNSNSTSDRAPGERGFPVMHAAPLDRFPRVKGGPFSHGVVAPKGFFGVRKRQQFGVLDVVDDGGVLEYVLSSRDGSGRILKDIYLRVRCDGDGCRAVE